MFRRPLLPCARLFVVALGLLRCASRRRRPGARIARRRSGSTAWSAISICCSGRSIAAVAAAGGGWRCRRGGQCRNPHGPARSADARPYRAGRGVHQPDRADPPAGRADQQRCRDAVQRGGRRRRCGRGGQIGTGAAPAGSSQPTAPGAADGQPMGAAACRPARRPGAPILPGTPVAPPGGTIRWRTGPAFGTLTPPGSRSAAASAGRRARRATRGRRHIARLRLGRPSNTTMPSVS